MKQEELNKLVEKFFAGETTVKEEAELKFRLQAKGVPDELKAVKSYFDAMNAMEGESLNESFEDVLMNKITREEPEQKSRLWIFTLASVAAAIALLIAVWTGTDLFKPKETYGTINDPKIAFAETKKILFEVSAKLKDGLAPAKKTMNTLEKNVKKAGKAKKINEALQKIGYIIKREKVNDLFKPAKKSDIKNGKS